MTKAVQSLSEIEEKCKTLRFPYDHFDSRLKEVVESIRTACKAKLQELHVLEEIEFKPQSQKEGGNAHQQIGEDKYSVDPETQAELNEEFKELDEIEKRVEQKLEQLKQKRNEEAKLDLKEDMNQITQQLTEWEDFLNEENNHQLELESWGQE